VIYTIEILNINFRLAITINHSKKVMDCYLAMFDFVVCVYVV